MSQRILTHMAQWVHPKDDETNVTIATFHLITITLISMSLVDLTWFTISGDVCVPYLTLGQFFWFGLSHNNDIDYTNYDCISAEIVNMMRIMILFCFMTIIFALIGFFLEICGPRNIVYQSLRKYAVMGTCTVIFILTIIGFSYYTIILLEESLNKYYPKYETSVSYGIGFYLLGASGVFTSCGIVYSLIISYYNSPYLRDDDRCILDAFDDGLDTFYSPTPPPPYSILPPPYTP
ncbi:unnamed protein product [Phaedon cochleariae]|uniref:Transmembrane protein 127 transmembrane region domain-containing protein n=1 Tax=Phaedon cochleariae TaxID=80249 RepID=A0A9P0DFH3_PHACE|nr:unnamed protein product [Phaedon cochleariae]